MAGGTHVRTASRVGACASPRAGAHVSAMQRRRILSSFVQVTGEQGLEGASVAEVCAQAGLSRRTFYESFSDREACLLAAFEDALERLTSAVLPVYRSDGPWHTRVRAALTVLLERFDADPGLARLCVVETLRGSSEVLERRARALAALAAAIDEGRSEAIGRAAPPLTAQGVVGGTLAVLYERLLDRSGLQLASLVGSLTAMVVHPYLGAASAERELAAPAPKVAPTGEPDVKDPFRGLSIRFTYRTARVLATIAATPGASNRQISKGAGIGDDGQTSRLLRRLRDAGLIENERILIKGEPNSWALTPRGRAIHTTLSG